MKNIIFKIAKRLIVINSIYNIIWVLHNSFSSRDFYIYVRINISIEIYLLFIAARGKKAKRSFQQRNNRVMPVWMSFTLLNLHCELSRRFSNMNNNSLAARKISVRLFFEFSRIVGSRVCTNSDVEYVCEDI